MVDHFAFQSRIAGFLVLLILLAAVSQMGQDSRPENEQPLWRKSLFYFCAVTFLILLVMSSLEYWVFEIKMDKTLLGGAWTLLRGKKLK